MSNYTDGKKTVKIEMRDWEDGGFLPDWEADFFNNGCLEYDEETDTYKVDDVDYLVEQALDYKYSVGDFADAWYSGVEGTEDHTPDDRGVWVDDEYMENQKLQAVWDEKRKKMIEEE